MVHILPMKKKKERKKGHDENGDLIILDDLYFFD